MVSHITKAVIVESTPGEGVLLWLPVGRELLIDHLLRVLSQHGIKEVAIITSEAIEGMSELIARIKEEQAIAVMWKVAPSYCGTAGSLKLVQEFLHDPQFVVVQSNLYLKGLHLRDMMLAHQQLQAGVTFAAYHSMEGREDLENIELDQRGLVAQVNILHGSRNRRRHLRPCGIYVMNREVLAMVPAGEYFDIKEQLVPALRKNEISVRAHVLKQAVYPIGKSEDLLELNRRVLLGDWLHPDEHDRWGAGSDGVIIGENAHISPSSYLLGPLVIGPNSIVDDHAQVIGPAVIGAATRLEKGCMVRESVILPGTRVRSNARVEYSFIPGDMIVPEGMRLRRAHRSMTDRENTSVLPHTRLDAVSAGWSAKVEGLVSGRPVAGRTFYLVVKRAGDLMLSSIGLLLGLPLFALIAVAIKLDSPGAVFFAQHRCGKGGKEFRMLKFRTMVSDAEQRQAILRARNAVDGPMFKLDDDPRITRVGKFLRKTSLDELPQLVNVLRGEMSLVGPRPLAYAEMKFCPSWRDLRLTVTPGVTGLWQVQSRQQNRFSDWIRYDSEYVQTQSLSTDLRILLRTVGALFKGV